MALNHASGTGHVGTRQFSPVEQRFEHTPRARRKILELDLFFCPEEYARTEAIRLHQALHEAHLVDAIFRKKSRKGPNPSPPQIPPPSQSVRPSPIPPASGPLAP